MLLKKRLAALMLLFTLPLSSCAAPADDAKARHSIEFDALAAAESYRVLLDETGSGDSSEILARLEEEGHAAVDIGGEQDFVNADILRDFLAAEHTDGDSVEFYRLCHDYGLICTRFYRLENAWRCATARVIWSGGEPRVSYTQDYPLTRLFISEKDYLIFTCDIPDNPGPTSHDGYVEPSTMLRLAPRDEHCDRYNEEYILSLGYNHHGLFTVTWDTGDFSGLCLNDLFLSLYRLEHGSYISYYDNTYPTLENSLVSMVPREEYEELIMKYLDMERGAVRSLSRYDEALDAYPIVISGVHDGLAKLPVPEVVEYRENSDGSITLTVDALFVEHATDRAFTHIVTVMPGTDGSFKYISNVLLDSGTNILPDYESYFGA